MDRIELAIGVAASVQLWGFHRFIRENINDAILEGVRPYRPKAAVGLGLVAELWELLRGCCCFFWGGSCLLCGGSFHLCYSLPSVGIGGLGVEDKIVVVARTSTLLGGKSQGMTIPADHLRLFG